MTDSQGNDFHPAWSPDGRKIAFVSDRDGTSEILRMRADGSRERFLTSTPGDNWAPAWSPDGNRIAFASNRDGNWDIYVMQADGSGQTNLTNSPLDQDKPSWSDAGTKIAYESCPDTFEAVGCEVYVMNADGSEQTNLTVHPAGDMDPVWSPGGRRIAFVTDRDVSWEIYVMNADGSGQNSLSEGYNPVWSPDGSQLAFASRGEIHVMNYDGTGFPRRVTENDEWQEDSPSWGPDVLAPRTSITESPSTSTADQTPTFRFRSNEPGSSFRCKLDFRRYRSCESPKSFRPLSVGTHTFRVRAIDAAGNRDATPAAFRWTIER